MAAVIGFPHVNTYREGVFQFIDMGDDNDPLKIILNAVNSLNQPLPPLHILSAKTLINH